MTEKDGLSAYVIVGPAQVTWWKYGLAKLAWALTRGNPIPGVGYLPGTHRVAVWAFSVMVLSRDMDVSTDTDKT